MSYPNTPFTPPIGSRPTLDAQTLAWLVPCACALVLRVLVAWQWPGVHHPDEVFQYLEQAYRFAYGYSIVPWDVRDGIRGGLLPALLWPGVAFAKAFELSTMARWWVAIAPLLVISVIGVASAARLARSVSVAHAWVAGLAIAVWFEHVYFSSRALTEPLAAALLFAMLYVLHAGLRAGDTRKLALAGALAVAVVAARFPLGPGVALASALMLRTDQRGWAAFIAGAALAAIGLGAIDMLVTGRPWVWMYNNLHANIIEGRSHRYGVEPVYWYAVQLLKHWGAAFVPLLVLASIGAKRFPAAAVAALMILLCHSLIGHKEYRFILPANLLMVFLASIGSVDLVRRAAAGGGLTSRIGLLTTAILWVGVSASLAVTGPARYWWTHGRSWIDSAKTVSRKPDLCGVGVVDFPWAATGGTFYLGKHVPIYVVPRADLDRLASSFDAAITDSIQPALEAHGFRFAGCSAEDSGMGRCVYFRAGACRPSPADEINVYLVRHDE